MNSVLMETRPLESPGGRTPPGGLRLWIALIVTVLWLAAMGWMLRFEQGRTGSGLRSIGVSPEVLMVSWVQYDHWMWFEQEGKRIGATHLNILPRITSESHSAQSPEAASGYLLQSRTRMKFRMLGMTTPVDLLVRVDMNESFELQTMQANLSAVGRTIEMEGFVEGQDFFYRVRIAEAEASGEGEKGRPTPMGGFLPERDLCGRTALDGPILLRDVVGPVLTHGHGKLKVGQRWSVSASDPLGGLFDTAMEVSVDGRETIYIEGEPVEAWRLTERVGSIQSTVWYDSAGDLLRHDLSPGIRLVRTERKTVHAFDEGFKRSPTLAVIDKEWIRSHIDSDLDAPPLKTLIPLMPRF